jgi:hypothetical protein
MDSVPSHDRNIPHIETIRFKDADGRLYAHKVFTKIMSNEQELPHASSEQHSFGRDEAVQKLTMECLKLQKLDIADGQNRLERTAKPVLTNYDQCQQRTMKHKQATQHGQQPQREVTADAGVATNVVHMQTSKGSESSTEQAPNPMAVPLAVPKEKSSLIAPTSHQALDPVAVPAAVHSQRSTVLAPTSEQASNPVAPLSANTLFTKLPTPK